MKKIFVALICLLAMFVTACTTSVSITYDVEGEEVVVKLDTSDGHSISGKKKPTISFDDETVLAGEFMVADYDDEIQVVDYLTSVAEIKQNDNATVIVKDGELFALIRLTDELVLKFEGEDEEAAQEAFSRLTITADGETFEPAKKLKKLSGSKAADAVNDAISGLIDGLVDAFNPSDQPTEPAQATRPAQTPAATEPAQDIPATTQPVQAPSGDLWPTQVVINGITLTLPCTVAELEATGYTMADDDRELLVKAGYETYVSFDGKGDQWGDYLSAGIYNDGDSNKLYTDCKICRISVDKDSFMGTFVISGGITFGATAEQIRGVFGTEDDIYTDTWDNGTSYASLTYNDPSCGRDYLCPSVEFTLIDNALEDITVEWAPQ